MAGLKGIFLLTVVTLALLTEYSSAVSPTKLCPKSYTKKGKCMKERRVTTTVHYGYDRTSGNCVKRESRVARRCGLDSESACRCYISGDPHYVSFDGQNMHFFGKCTYVLTKPVSGASKGCRWSILGKNRMRGGSPYTYLEELIKRRLYIGKVFHGLPYRIHKPDVMVQYMGNKIVLHSRQCGIRVSFDGDAEAIIKVQARYRNKLSGICGNCDGKRNDLRTASGRNVSGMKNKFTLIGNSYLAPGTSKSCSGPNSVRCSSAQMSKAMKACKSLINSASPFRRCMKNGGLSLDRYYTDCMQDMCAASHFARKSLIREARCQSYAAAAEICASKGFPSKDWRSAAGCPLRCPSGMRYESNRKTCQKTCESLFFGVNSCPQMRSEGCFCKPGLVLDGNLCVKKEDCRCLQCADLRSPSDCASWKLKGRCSSEPEVMYKYCRLTCNMCQKHKCVDLIATNTCLEKKRAGKCEDSFYKEFCGLTCHWKSCQCPEEGSHYDRGNCESPRMVRKVTKTTVFRSVVSGVCTKSSVFYYEPCGDCEVINKVVEKKPCNYCTGQRVMEKIKQHRVGIYCTRKVKEFTKDCTCAFRNGKVKYLHSVKCKNNHTKVFMYREKRVSKDCKRCDLVKSNKVKRIKCQSPPPTYNPSDKCPRGSNSQSTYTRTICRVVPVDCACSKSCHSKTFDCSCGCLDPIGQDECEISRRCDRVGKRLVIRYKAEILVKDKYGDGVCTKKSPIVHSEKRPCNYKRIAYYTCDKDKSGKLIGCPTTKDKNWPPRWYNYKEGYLDDDCNCKTKNAKKVYQDNYCCCPKPYVIREPNEEYGTGKCEKAESHYRMLVVRISYVHNSESGECVKQKSEWYEVCRCDDKPEREECIDKPNYGLFVRYRPHCKLVDANTSNARCECGETLKSRKVYCRKAPRYLQRKGKCDIKRGRAIYRRVYKEITYRKKCACRTRVEPELEPCKECVPKENKELIPCPKNCENKMGRCSVNCKKYYVTYFYSWNDVSKTCVAREVNRIPSRCCCKPYYRPPNGPGTDEKQEVGPVCHESGKYWKYYINRQYLCGKKYKKCCRKRIKRLVPIPCKTGRRKKVVHCSDGKNIKKFVLTRVFLKDCKCQKRVRVKPCKCRCPKSKSFVKCEHETNTYAHVHIYYVIRNCRCHKQVNTKRRREPCEVTRRREVFNNYDACMSGKTSGFMYTRKFSRFYMKNCVCKEQKLEKIKCHCKCPKKTTKTKERCNGMTGYLEWTVTKQKKSGCLCKPKTYKRKREFTCPTQRDRIEVSCNKKTGIRITTQFNFRRIDGTCRCGWVKVDEREDRCNCDLENIKIQPTNKHNEKHPACRHNRWYYETFEYYITVRDGLSVCVKRSMAGGSDVPCNRDESVLPVGRCNTRTRRQRYQKIWFELRACHCTKRSSYFFKPCGCPKDKPQKRRKVDHECDGQGNWILTWEFYRWNEKSQVCEREEEKQTRSVTCKPEKKQVSKTDCYKGHYQVTIHTSKVVESKCTCKTDEKITVLPCVCQTITRTGKHCHEDPKTLHSYRKITTIIRKWNDKKERCEVDKKIVERRICKCRKRILAKPDCKDGNWITKITKFVMELNKNGDRVCTEVEKFRSKPKICNDQVRFETTKNKCKNRRTDTIYYSTKKDVLKRADCTCVEREIKRKPCKCWCSDRQVFKYSRCQDDKVTISYYAVERLEGCKCVKRQIKKMKTLSCKKDIVKRTRGPCNRRNKCTRPIFGWVNEEKNCQCVPRKLPEPIGHEKCDCCKKSREIGEWFCKKKIYYRYIITRTWKPEKKKCLVVKTKEAKGVQCPPINPKKRFVYTKCKKYRRVKYSLHMYLNPDTCACETKREFVAVVWCQCPPTKKEEICRKDKFLVTKVTVYTLRGENCEKSKSYSPPVRVPCVKPPNKPDGRGGKMNCLRIRYIPYAKVIGCKCHRGYKEEMEEYTTGVWCCKHRPECKDVSKPYCDKKSNTWFSTVSKCVIVNKQCVRRTSEKSGLAVTCSSKPIGKPSVSCDQKTKIEVTTTKYEKPRNCECHTYTVTTTSVCGCNRR
uniref:ShKT domain-containing protein n=1 Tax=Macrostomum lignano TaxID=282301 RepID=A0A1I8GE37_9PLAT